MKVVSLFAQPTSSLFSPNLTSFFLSLYPLIALSVRSNGWGHGERTQRLGEDITALNLVKMRRKGK
jgi:hypothetical protein